MADNALEVLTDDQLKAMSPSDLTALNQQLMAEKEAIADYQVRVKAALNHHVVKAKLDALPEAERKALVQHIKAGSIDASAA